MIIEHIDISPFILRLQSTLEEVMKMIEDNKKGIVFILDENSRLKGSISDGDVRRAILKGNTVKSKAMEVMHTSPIALDEGYADDEAQLLLKEKDLKLIPIIDDSGQVKKIVSHKLDEDQQVISNPVVLMVGGEGKRLSPLTDDTPKPLLKVDGKPILQIILEKLFLSGFRNVFLCTGYKSEAIEQFCEDGSKFGLSIKYFREDKKLGTIGAVKYLEDSLKEPFLVMNGDLLTMLNFKNILDFHLQMDSELTIGSKEYSYTIPYGVLELEGIDVQKVIEKPSVNYRVSAGVYVLNSSILKYIPKGEYCDITELMEDVLSHNHKVSAFPIEEYWLDIGQPQDYDKANSDYNDYFSSK